MINYSVGKRLTNIAEYQIAKKANPSLTQETWQGAKWLFFGNAQTSETMTLMDFAKHISSHGSVYSRADISSILIQTVDCLREMLLEGKVVELGELGSFRVSLETDGAEYMDEFSVNNIRRVNVIWNKGMLFTTLRDDASFREVLTVNSTSESIAAAKKAAGSRPESGTIPSSPSSGGGSSSGNTPGGSSNDGEASV